MFNRKITFAALTVASVLVLFVVSAGYLSLSSLRVEAQEPSKADAGGSKQKDLLKERLAVVREIAKLSTEAYKAGTASYDEVREANHTMFQAELEQCDTAKDRIAILEKIVSEAKKMEEIAGQFSKTGLATNQTALKAKAERLQAEIALEQAKTKAEGQTGLQHNDHVALAEKRVAIKRAAVKIAQAQKTIAVARLGSLKGQVAEAQAAESFAEKQAKRFEELVKQRAVSAELVDERRTQLDAAKAHRTAAEGKVVECEAQVLFEEARVELAHLEVSEAELRLKQLKARLEKQR